MTRKETWEKTKMMEMYGKAVIDERLKPRHLAEIAGYVRREYGLGTGPGFLLAAMDDRDAQKPRRDRPVDALLRALAKAMKAIVPGNGNGRKAKTVEPTR